MNISKKRFHISNLSTKKLNFFGGSSDLEPILYKNYTVPSVLEKDGLIMSLKANLSELDDLCGQLGYINSEISKILKK